MADISAALVRDLREKTGAGMLDCKKALVETNGNIEEAVDWLRKKGLAAAAKKAGRVAAEGLVGLATSSTAGVVVEVNSETDFVARNDQFQNLVSKVAQIALSGNHDNVESLKSAGFDGTTVGEGVTNLVAVIGENMNLRRVQMLKINGSGVIASYIHNAMGPNIGKIGVLVALESNADKAKLEELGKKIAMHVAAAQPQFLDTTDVDNASLERERNVLADQARASGRPEDIIQKMVDGRIRKYYEEVVLLEQNYVIDGQSRVRDVVEQFGKELGSPIKLVGFVRFNLGEGIEKAETDFAAEVKAQANR